MPTNNRVSHTKLILANKDSKEAAKAAKLIYVSDTDEGIRRVKKGKGFVYYTGKKVLKTKKELDRIKKLVIPPAWEDVWICHSPNGHIQATGIDFKGRKQYRYHAAWSQLRNETKYHHLFEFGKHLPKLRKKVNKDLRTQDLSRDKVLAAAIDLMEKTYIRIGSESYEKQNGSYGLTTLKDKHISFKHDKLNFSFSGKKGVKHNIWLKNKRLARIIKQCRDIPGKTLFQYYDEEGKPQTIDSTMLNNYIKEATAPEFSAKDIRTWAGSVQAINYQLANNGETEEKNGKSAVAMLDWVSEKLGNTRNVCKKYYVHPSLITFCEEKNKLPDIKKTKGDLSESEQLLMCILKNK
jgi:DNA topoisomerase-1